MERVTGPWHGFFVAAYTTELNGTFYGYSKLFETAPEGPWGEGPVLKLGTRGFTLESEALKAAVRRGITTAAEISAAHHPAYWAHLIEPVTVAANDDGSGDISGHDVE